MAARVVCGSQPEAAARSSSVAPSGRETASSRTPSLPPGRARCVSGCARCSGTASGVPSPACALSTPMASRPAGGYDQTSAIPRVRVGAADPLRHLGACRRRRLGDQAAAEQGLQGSLERGAFEPERLGRRQDAQIRACGSGGEQRPPGCRRASAPFFPFGQGAARNARPGTGRRPEQRGCRAAGGDGRCVAGINSDAPQRAEVQQTVAPTRLNWSWLSSNGRGSRGDKPLQPRRHTSRGSG